MTESIQKCIVCSECMPKQQLIRIIKTANDQLVLDTENKKDGQRYYICKSSACISRLKEENILNKMTGIDVPAQFYLDIARIFKNSKKNNIIKLIEFANRSKKIVIGISTIEIFVKKNKVSLILMEKSTQKNTRNIVYSLYERFNVPFFIYDEDKSLEQITGRLNCKCIGFNDRDFSRQLIHEFKRQSS